MLGPFFYPEEPEISLDLAVLTQKACWQCHKAVCGVSHWSNRLNLLKLISIILLWIHTGRLMYSWTCLDPSSIQMGPKSAWIWQCLHKLLQQKACWQFHKAVCGVSHWSNKLRWSWNSSVSFIYGSILDIWCVAGHAWTLLPSKWTQNQLGSDSVHTNCCNRKHAGSFIRQFVESPMDPTGCIWWNYSSVSFFYGSILGIWCIAVHAWTLFSPRNTQNQSGSGSANTESMLAVSKGNCGVSHGSNGLYLLKLISIILLRIYTGHLMCSWTCLDPFLPRRTRNQPGSSSVNTESMLAVS